MNRRIYTQEHQPDQWTVWAHVTGDGNDYHERIGGVTKLGPRRFSPCTETGIRLDDTDSLIVARIALAFARDAGAPAYHP